MRLHADYLLSSHLILSSSPSCHREPRQEERMRKYDFLSSLMPIKWGRNERGVLSRQEGGVAPSVASAVALWLRAEKIISEGWWTLGTPHTQPLFVLRLLEGVCSVVWLSLCLPYTICGHDSSSDLLTRVTLITAKNLRVNQRKHCYHVHGWESCFQLLD